MLRHFFNATALASSRSLLAKRNAPVYVSSTRSLFIKPNPPVYEGHLFSSSARTSSRPLLVKRNASVIAWGARWVIDRLPIADENRWKATLLFSVLYTLTVAGIALFCAWDVVPFVVAHWHNDFRCFSFEELDEVTSKGALEHLSYMGEYADANKEFKAIKGSGMPQHTFFWWKPIVVTKMKPEIDEMLVDCKRDGIRVEGSKNFCFVITTSESERARVAERIGKLRDIRSQIRAESREEYAWGFMGFDPVVASSSNRPGETKPRSYRHLCHMDACFMGQDCPLIHTLVRYDAVNPR